MASKYSQAEWDALDKKMENPDSSVRCPRCGNEIVYRAIGNSCEAKCLSEGCIKETVRGL